LIVAQDILEHLEQKKIPAALAEWSRLLTHDGVLELRVPSLFDLFVMLAAPEKRSAVGSAEVIHLLYGTQAYAGDYHLSGFTAELLEDLLAKSGLLVCTASLLHGWLFEVRARRTEALKDDREFVHHAYFQILGRPVDASGLESYVDALSHGHMSRAEVRHTLASSDEARFLATHPRYLLPHATRLIGVDGTLDIASLRARVAGLEVDLRCRDAEIATLRGSRSWRMTRPLRMLLEIARRVRR
jgi:hypothetical protein